MSIDIVHQVNRLLVYLPETKLRHSSFPVAHCGLPKKDFTTLILVSTETEKLSTAFDCARERGIVRADSEIASFFHLALPKPGSLPHTSLVSNTLNTQSFSLVAVSDVFFPLLIVLCPLTPPPLLYTERQSPSSFALSSCNVAPQSSHVSFTTGTPPLL